MTDDELPYLREELIGQVDGLPDRGVLCPCCRVRIPQFSDLSDSDAYRIRLLIAQEQKSLAIAELRAATGCSATFAKIWVTHSGRPNVLGTTAPCPYCRRALVTALAKQCQHCFMDWHDPEKPYNLKGGMKPTTGRNGLVACACCGYSTIDAKADFEICPICFWEDDGQDETDADEDRDGPNRVSLTSARINFLTYGASDRKDLSLCRAPNDADKKLRHFTLLGGSIIESSLGKVQE